MSKLLSALIAAVFATVTFSAVAADAAMAPAKPAAKAAASKKMTAQQERMKTCNGCYGMKKPTINVKIYYMNPMTCQFEKNPKIISPESGGALSE